MLCNVSSTIVSFCTAHNFKYIATYGPHDIVNKLHKNVSMLLFLATTKNNKFLYKYFWSLVIYIKC